MEAGGRSLVQLSSDATTFNTVREGARLEVGGSNEEYFRLSTSLGPSCWA